MPEALTNTLPNAIVAYAHLGTVVILFGLLYYLRLSLVLFIGMLLFSALVLLGIHQIAQANIAPLWLVMLIIFVVAWIGEFIGHNHEGKKPSFLKDLQFLLERYVLPF